MKNKRFGGMFLGMVMAGAVMAGGSAFGSNLYFDVNSNAPGSGVVGGTSYNWNGSFWSTDSTGGSSTVAYSAATPVFEAGTDAVGKTYTVTVNAAESAAGLTFLNADTVTLAKSGSFVLTLTGSAVNVAAGGAVTIAPVIGGSVGLNKAGAGTLSLTATNTYTGGTTLSAGVLSFASKALDAGGMITFGGSSTLQWNATTEDVSVTGMGVTIGDGVNATLDTQANNVTLSKAFGVGTLASGALTKVGAGTLTLSAVNTYNGGTTINGGTVSINSDGAIGASGSNLTINNGTLYVGSNVTLSHNITLGSGSPTIGAYYNANITATGITMSGTGSLSFGNGNGTLNMAANNTYSGGTTLTNSGTINVAAGSTGPVGGLTSGPLGTGTITFAGGFLNASVTGLTLANALQFSNGSTGAVLGASGSKTVTYTGPMTLASGLNWIGTVGGATLSGAISDLTSGGGFYDNQNGTLTIGNASNSFSGGVSLNSNGALVQISAGSTGPVGGLTGGPLGTGTLSFGSNGGVLSNTSGSTVTLGNALQFGSLTKNATLGGVTMTGPVALGAGANLVGAASSTTVTLSGVVSDQVSGQAGGINDTQGGKLVLSGANTFSGGVSVSGSGVVVLAGINNGVVGNITSSPLGTGGLTIGAAGIVASDTATSHVVREILNPVTISGSFQVGNYGDGTSVKISGPVTLNASPTISPRGALEIASNLTGTNGIGLNYTDQALTLSGSNTYSGLTSLNPGVLLAGSVNGLSLNSQMSLGNSNSTLELMGYSNSVGSLVGVATSGVQNGGSAAAVLTMGNDNSASATFAGNFTNGSTGALGIAKTGTGIEILSGVNSYTGSTTVSQGKLSAGSTTALGTNAALVMAGGTLDLAGYSNSVGSLTGATGTITNSGGVATLTVGGDGTSPTGYAGTITQVTSALTLVKTGSGILTLSGNNSYTGGTTVANNSGTVVAGSANALGTSGTITVGGSGVLDVGSGVTFTRAVTWTGTNGGGTLGGLGTYTPGSTVMVGGVGNVGVIAAGIADGTNNYGKLAIGNGVQVNSGTGWYGALNFATSGALASQLNVTGALTITGGNLNVSGVPTLGKYVLATATGGITGSLYVATMPTNYKAVYTSGELDLVHKADESITAANVRLMASHTTTGQALGMLNNTAPVNSSALGTTLSASGSGLTISGLGLASGTTVAGGGSTAILGTIVAGTTTGSVGLTVGNADANAVTTTTSNTSGTVTVVGNRVISASSVSLGLLHVGASASGTSTLSTSGDHSHATDLVVNGVSFNNAGATTSVSISPTLAAGNLSSTVPVGLTVSGEGLSGEVDQSSVNVPYTAQVFNGTGTYAGGSGNYSVATSWSDANGVQAAPGTFSGYGDVDTANFSGAGGTVNMDASPSLNALTLGGSNAYAIAGTGTLHMGGTAPTITASSDGQSISAPISLDSGTTITVATGTLNITQAFSGTGSLSKAGAGQLDVASLPTAVSVANGILQLGAAGSSHTLETLGSLAITGGKLDLTNHDLFISGAAGSLASLAGKVMSSGTNPTAGSTTTIALMSGSEYLALGRSTIGLGAGATSVTGGDLVGVLAYGGDANLDGKVGAEDYLALDLGYMFGLSGWTHGDFDQDGTIGVDDFAVIDNNYRNQSGSVADGEIALHTQWFGAAYTDVLNGLNVPAAVPEPASLGLLGLGAVGLLRRKRVR